MRKLHWFVTQDDAFYKGRLGYEKTRGICSCLLTTAVPLLTIVINTMPTPDAHLFSFGGTQSNAMLAIAQLAHAKRVPFTYFSRGLQLHSTSAAANITSDSNTRSVRVTPLQQGNLALAEELGMQHVALSPELYQALAQTKDFSALSPSLPNSDKLFENTKRALYIPQGAAFEQAQQGLALLAQEVNAYIANERLTDPDKRYSVVVPCGTGTTALYMAQHLDSASAKLFAVPCVGDAAYLELQFAELVAKDASLRALQCNSTLQLPRIVEPRQKSRFGRLWWPLYDIHHELLDGTGIAFDLIYGSFAWHTMFDGATLALLLGEDAQLDMKSRQDENGTKRELMYVHTGGVSGNVTMLARYEAKRKSQSSDLNVESF